MKAIKTITCKSPTMEFSFMLIADVIHHYEAPSEHCTGGDWCELQEIKEIEIEIVHPGHEEAELVEGTWRPVNSWFEGLSIKDPDHIKVCVNVIKSAFGIDAEDEWTTEDLDRGSF